MTLLLFRWKASGPTDDPSTRLFSTGSDGVPEFYFAGSSVITFTSGDQLSQPDTLFMTGMSSSFVSGNQTSQPSFRFTSNPDDTFVYGTGTDQNSAPVFFSVGPRDIFTTQKTLNTPALNFSKTPGTIKGAFMTTKTVNAPPIRLFVQRPLAVKGTFMWGPNTTNTPVFSLRGRA